jgi:hypothetical protein
MALLKGNFFLRLTANRRLAEPLKKARMGYMAAMFNCLLQLLEGKLAIGQFSL